MNAVILSCSNLAVYVKAAQETCGTDYPVVFLDQTNHVVSGRWDRQFLVLEPGKPVTQSTIFDD